MKKIFNILLIVLAVGIFASCENEVQMFDESMSFIAFTSKTASVEETDKILNIPVLVTAMQNSPAVEVSYTIKSEGFTVPAIEGEDFIVLSGEKLSFPDGFGYDTIQIQTIDNDVFTGAKRFSIHLESNTQGYDFGAVDSIIVNITDDDHPFGWMLGNYTADGTLWRADGVFSWDMTLSPVENDIYAVEIIGLISAGGYGHPATEEFIVYGKITENEEDGTYQLGIQTDQEIPTWGYGPCTIVGWHGPDGAEAIGSGEYIIGDIIDNNGAVTIEMRDEYGLYIFEGNNAGLYLDIVIGDGSSPTIAVWTRK